MSTLLASMFIAAAVNFCGGVRQDGETYKAFINRVGPVYMNTEIWTREVRNGQKAVCGKASF